MRAPSLHIVALLTPFLAVVGIVVVAVIFDCLSGGDFPIVIIVGGVLLSMRGVGVSNICKGESSSSVSTHDIANALYSVQ